MDDLYFELLNPDAPLDIMVGQPTPAHAVITVVWEGEVIERNTVYAPDALSLRRKRSPKQ